MSGTVGGRIGSGFYSVGLIGGGLDAGLGHRRSERLLLYLPAGRDPDLGESLVTYTSGAPFVATNLSIYEGGTTQAGTDLFTNAVTTPTSALLLSQAPTLAQAQAQTLAATGIQRDRPGGSRRRHRLVLVATGPSFTIDQPVTTRRPHLRGADGPGRVADRRLANHRLNDGGTLGLLSGGTLAINAPVTIDGAGLVGLAYNTASPTNFSFGNGAALTFANIDGSTATSSQGGSLKINNQAYTLLYNLAGSGSTGPDTGLDDIARHRRQQPAAGGDAGLYALATNLTGTGTARPRAAVRRRPGGGQRGRCSVGVFEGLGHTLTDLTLASTVSGTSTGQQGVGLFAYNTRRPARHRPGRRIGDGCSITPASACWLETTLRGGTVVQAYATGAGHRHRGPMAMSAAWRATTTAR